MSDEPQEQPAVTPGQLLIEYTPPGDFKWTMTGHVPINQLIGTMELIKAMLLNNQINQIQAAQEKQSRLSKLIVPQGRIQV